MDNYPNSPQPEPKKSYAFQLILYWAIVLIPLGWGVYQTLTKTYALFTTLAGH